jgi:O-antigen ligase
VLYATLAIFSASFIYNPQIAAVLTTLKWVPLFGLLGLLVVSALKRPELTPSGALPALVIALIAVAAVATIMGEYRGRGSAVLIGLIATLGVSLLLAKRINAFSAENEFFRIVANVGRVVVLVSFVMAMLGMSLGRGERFSGWTDNPNSLGMLLAPTIVILAARVLERRKAWILWDFAFLAAGLYVLLLTGSRSSIGWVCLSLLGFALSRVGRSALVFTTFMSALFIELFNVTLIDVIVQLSALIGRKDAEISGHVFSGRNEVWQIGFEKFSQNWLGYGIGSSQPLLESSSWRFVTNQGIHFHSSYLTALVEAGALGFILLLVIIVLAMVIGFQSIAYLRKAPIQIWSSLVLPWVLLFGAVFHAATESWLLSGGNPDTLLIWVVIALNFRRRRMSQHKPYHRAIA